MYIAPSTDKVYYQRPKVVTRVGNQYLTMCHTYKKYVLEQCPHIYS